MKNYALLFLLAVFVFGTACNNGDDDNGVILSGYDKMVDKNFRLVGIEISANGQIIANGSNLLDCEKDNVNRYESSGTAFTRFGAMRCDPNEPVEDSYFWSLISNESKLILDYSGPSLRVYNILTNDGSRLTLERYTIEDIDNDGTQESIRTITWYSR